MQQEKDIFGGLGVPIRLKKPDDFLIVKETLTRIGVASRYERKLFQSCHILHKRGQYAIVHFKEMFMLDGKPSNITVTDIARRNTIANILSSWNLVILKDAKISETPVAPLNQIKIISSSEKKEWDLIPKYNMGFKPK